MKKASLLAVLALGMILVNSPQAEAGTTYLDMNDGQTHNFSDDYSAEYNSYVMRVDYQKPGMNTTVNYLAGAKIHVLQAWEDSRVNVYGGSLNGLDMGDRTHLFMSGGGIGQSLNVWGDAEATIVGGGAGRLFVSENGYANVSSGSFGQLAALMSGQIDMSNGSIGNIVTGQKSAITLVGSDFAIDGVPVDFGSITSVNGNDYVYETIRQLTGTFSGGSTISCDFRLGDSSQIILEPVPEPMSAAMLAFGGLLLRRRRR